MADWIRHYHDRLIVIATKIDKLKKREIEINLEMIYNDLELTDDDILVPFSVNDEEGRVTVWDMIEMMIASEKYDK